MSRTPRWGFVGLGQMGLPMAARLASAGFPVTALCLRPAHRDAALSIGAKPVDSTEGLGAACEVIGVCVRDDSQLIALMERDGLLGRSRPGTLFVIHSTVTPQLCRRFADSAGPAGTRLIDAPVSGLPERARNGTLTAFVGGADADVQEAWSGLSTMASRILHTGGVGSGQTTKILNNLVSLSTVAAVAEALRMAADLGLDTAAVRHALESASADSFTLRHWDFFEGEWLSGGREAAAELAAKDLHLANTLNAIRPPLMADAATRALRRHLGL